jgi:hypothetical protein
MIGSPQESEKVDWKRITSANKREKRLEKE